MVRCFRIGLAVVGLLLGRAPAGAEEWLLNPEVSRLFMQTAKANAIIETHRFTGLSGSIADDGKAEVKIDLLSVKSGIDVRDVRMRFLLFQAYKFPFALVTAEIDRQKFLGLGERTRLPYDLTVALDLHGVKRTLTIPVTVTRISDKSVAVTTAEPVVVNAESFDLKEGIAKLSEAVNGTPIVTAASISFDLLFETGEKVAQLRVAGTEAVRARAAEESAPITREGCQTRFGVISNARAIYFHTASAELDPSSDALLDSVADIARRCHTVSVEVSGHTDSVGQRAANQLLSEQRARAVQTYLVGKGVARARIDAVGYGDSRPVVPNDNEANRARNRRIEFTVKSN